MTLCSVALSVCRSASLKKKKGGGDHTHTHNHSVTDTHIHTHISHCHSKRATAIHTHTDSYFTATDINKVSVWFKDRSTQKSQSTWPGWRLGALQTEQNHHSEPHTHTHTP